MKKLIFIFVVVVLFLSPVTVFAQDDFIQLSEKTIAKLNELLAVLQERPEKWKMGISTGIYLPFSIGNSTTDFSVFSFGLGGEIDFRWINGPFPMLSEELKGKRNMLLKFLQELKINNGKLLKSEADTLIYMLADTEVAEIREDLDKLSYGFFGYSYDLVLSGDYASNWVSILPGFRFSYIWSGVNPDMNTFHYSLGGTLKVGLSFKDDFSVASFTTRASFDFSFNIADNINLPLSAGVMLRISNTTQVALYVEIRLLITSITYLS